ncbi:MAG: hypothetical protein MZV70_42880 [Desulfobacterales bacterium]|nr:hypothetical protein [Desulfobacterales bacterium]
MVGRYVMTENELLKKRPTPGARRHGLLRHRLAQRPALRHARRVRAERGRHRRVRRAGPYRDRLRRARAEAGPGDEPARARLRVQLAHRLRFDPHGAGLHDPRAVRRDRGGHGDRRRASRCRTCPTSALRARLLADGQVLALRGRARAPGALTVPVGHADLDDGLARDVRAVEMQAGLVRVARREDREVARAKRRGSPTSAAPRRTRCPSPAS